MFENTLLESSPRRSPVLRRIHFLISTFLGVVVFALCLRRLPAVLVLAAPHAILAAGAIAGTATALQVLMLCYVWADTRHHELIVWPWLATTLMLSLPGFLLYLIYAAAKSGDWKRAAIPLAYMAETLFVSILTLAPLVYTQALPKSLSTMQVHIGPPPGPPPAQAVASQVRPAHHEGLNPLEAPPSIPVGVQRIVEAPEPPEEALVTGSWVPGAITGSGSQEEPGILGGMAGGTQPPPPPPETHSPARTRIIHVGGQVIAAQGVYQPNPVYPSLAIAARVQGTVVLEAVIGKDGRVEGLKVVSGPALLIRAALDAVKTWRYQPTLLNGEPVEVQTEISVNFALAQ